MNVIHATDPVPVAGLTRLTTIDFPGALSAVIYLQGCPWRCGYCHNSDLQPRDVPSRYGWGDFLSWLETRIGLLDAVVFSGGEPTLHKKLGEAMRQVRALGFKIGLHTAGIYPAKLAPVLPLVDWVGLDIKAARSDYARISGVEESHKRAWKSAELLLDSGVEYEIRTTVHPDQLSLDDLQHLVKELGEAGVKNYAIQHCVLNHCAEERLRGSIHSRPPVERLNELGRNFTNFEIRDVA